MMNIYQGQRGSLLMVTIQLTGLFQLLVIDGLLLTWLHAIYWIDCCCCLSQISMTNKQFYLYVMLWSLTVCSNMLILSSKFLSIL